MAAERPERLHCEFLSRAPVRTRHCTAASAHMTDSTCMFLLRACRHGPARPGPARLGPALLFPGVLSDRSTRLPLHTSLTS